MKALILAGGLGNRLKPLTDDTPKSLIMVGNKTILGRIIDSLVENHVDKIVIITGHFEDKIKEFVSKNYPGLSPIYVFNPQYKNSKIRYIYAMCLAREFLDDDIIYIHGDVFCDPVLISKLVKTSGSGALVQKSFASDKDFNALIVNNLIKKIGVKVFGKKVGFCLPVYKLLKRDFGLWMEEICEYVDKNKVDCYAENALNEIMNKIKLSPVYFDKEIGMEIDDFDDLEKAEQSNI